MHHPPAGRSPGPCFSPPPNWWKPCGTNVNWFEYHSPEVPLPPSGLCSRSDCHSWTDIPASSLLVFVSPLLPPHPLDLSDQAPTQLTLVCPLLPQQLRLQASMPGPTVTWPCCLRVSSLTLVSPGEIFFCVFPEGSRCPSPALQHGQAGVRAVMQMLRVCVFWSEHLPT